jgi:hypothetical protein
MPNALANLALLAWPGVSVLLFLLFRPPLAVLITFIGAMMYLPEKTVIDLPMQDFGKIEVASIGAMLGCLLSPSARTKLFRHRFDRYDAMWLLYMLSAFGTTRTNPDGMRYADTIIPGLNTYEGVAMIYSDVLALGIPYLLGRTLFTTRADAKLLLRAFLVAAIAYVPFIAIELVMSPQLHNWVYGFAQHDFIQTMRAGGYRPMAFMAHGLGLTLFLAASALAGVSLTLAQTPGPWRIRGRWLSAVLIAVLLACKSLGAAVFAFGFAAVLHVLKPAAQVRVFMLLCALVLLYPASRASGVFPEKELMSFVINAVGPERAQSLEFRFQNEHELAERASERPWFGWGRFGRSQIFSIWTGQPTSVSDGQWIIIYGVRGMVGFLLFFIALFAPVLSLRSVLARLGDARDRAMLAGLGCIVMLYTVDLIPNGLFTNYPVFVAGALLGLGRGFVREAPTMTITINTAPGTT